VVGLASATIAVVACSQAAPLVGQGGTCQVTTDCQDGLACITQPDGTRQCSSDFTGIQSTESDAETDAPAMATGDGAAPASDTGSPPADTGTTPQDTGAAPQEAGGD